jgi:hypothetical protein
MYNEDFCCVAEKSKILVKEKGKKFFTYKPVNRVIKLITEKKIELFSLDTKYGLNKITKIESIGSQDFYEIKTFSGCTLYLGKDTEICVDSEWLPMNELLFHEKIFVYDVLNDMFHDTYITSIKKYRHMKAVKIYSENEYGIVVNNFMIRFVIKEEEV